LTGFGIVNARLGLVETPWFGPAMVLSGALALIWSASHYLRLTQTLRSGKVESPHRPLLAVALAVLLGIVSLTLATHLMRAKTQEVSMSSENGIITIPSRHSVEATAKRLEETLAAKNVKVFALIDHSGEAAKAGFEMHPCKLLIFGNPKAGTPLMLAAPTAALDLPLKILVWERGDGAVWISYNDSTWLQQRHGLSSDLMANISVVPALAAKAAE
jgi:uncharacterized protein (DUF302 family)